MIRSVILLQSSESPTDVRSALHAAGWVTRRVYDPHAIAEAGPGKSCVVGIAVVDGAARFDPNALFAAVSSTDMEWVALASPDASRNSEVARVLTHGFFDFHSLPLDATRLLYSLGHAYGKAMMRKSLDASRAQVYGRYGMVGDSPQMNKFYKVLDKIIDADAPVLIQGESGTGKEVAALAVHAASRRAHAAFVTVNCGAIPPTLVQTELFGHEKGAFTGAHRRNLGSIEAASGGTIFLDEIGDLPLEAQASLLRFLQESTITRVGACTPIRVDSRVIAASHVDLEAAVRAGRFREDLYYRLNVLRADLPPLRERGDDIRLIAESIFEASRGQRRPDLQGFAPEAVQAMLEYTWPGNVRELINRVRRAMIMGEGRFILPADLGLGGQQPESASISLAHARRSGERDTVVAALERNGSNMAAASRELGVSRVTLYRLVQRLGIGR